MWPNAEIAVMGGEQAAGVLVTLRNDQLAKEGKPPMSAEEVRQISQPVIAAARTESNAYYSTAQLWDDGILDPVDTRDVLGSCPVGRHERPESATIFWDTAFSGCSAIKNKILTRTA